METRGAFHRQLEEVQTEVLAMGSMVDKAIGRAIDALRNRDLDLAHQVIREDKLVNKKRFDIEEKCVQLIATQQPMAGDLRALVSVLNIVTELERMGDYAEGIAKISIMIGGEPPLKPLIDIPRMAELGRDMIRRSLQALVDRNVAQAAQVCHDDDQVDGLYDQVFRELITFVIEDPRTITRATRLIWVAHNLERIADRATNIAERVVFLVTGKMEEIGASRY